MARHDTQGALTAAEAVVRFVLSVSTGTDQTWGMTVAARVVIELLAADDGGLIKPQASGTRSLLYRFDIDRQSTTYGAFLDLDDGRPVEPGIGPVGGVLTFWAESSERISAGDRFDIVYPERLVGRGYVETLVPPAPLTPAAP